MNNKDILKREQRFGPGWGLWLNRLGPMLGLLVVYGFFSVIAPASFTTGRNMEMIARQTTIVGIAALGMTLVIISGGIDLSVGSIVALSTVVVAWLLQYAGAGPVTAALGGVAAAAFTANGGQRVHVSISHEREFAVATVVIED